MRLLFVLALGLVLLVGGGAVTGGTDPCEQDCPGDSADGGCALEACCSCCVHARFDPPDSVRTPPRPAVAGSPAALRSAAVPSPDPRDILHVPKPSFL